MNAKLIRRVILLALGLTLIVIGALRAESRSYTLKGFMQDVSKKHPDQKLSSYEPKIAAAEYHERRDIFSPFFTTDLNRLSQKNSELSSPLIPSFPMTNGGAEFGVSKVFPQTGTRISGGLSMNKNESYYNTLQTATTTGVPSDISGGADHTHSILSTPTGDQPLTAWSTGVNFTLAQPLLRNGPIGLSGKKQIDLAKNAVRLNRSIYNTKMEGLMMGAYSLYWQYLLTKELLSLALASKLDAERMVENTRDKLNLGTAELSDLYDFEASLARARIDYQRTQNDFLELKKDIIYYLALEDKNAVLNFSDNLAVQEISLDREKILENALKYRKDLEQANLQHKMSKLTLDIAKSAMLPKLDLFGSVDFVGSSENAGDAFSYGFTNATPNITLGIQFEMPLDFRAFRTVKEKAELNYQKSDHSLNKMRLDIEKEINTLISSLENEISKEKLQSEGVEIIAKKLTEYNKKYKNGKIESYQLILAQNDDRMWKQLHLSTIFAVKMAQAKLLMSQGIFLQNYEIKELNVQGKVK